MKLLSQAKKTPSKPGVYLFINKRGKVLYVGRATSLKRRILSYFQKDLGPRIREMVDLAYKIKYKKTDTILESVILEANLIKKYWPKYNIRERDDRSFVYIIIPKTDYPWPFIVRGREIRNLKLEIRNSYIFGPYQSLSLVKNALKIIRRIFQYSTCLPAGRPATSNSGKPCFDYQIGLCPGACIGKISRVEYQKNINHIILLLSGERNKLLKKLEKENPEKARSLQHIQDVALISREESVGGHHRFNRIEGYDISHLTGKETFGSMVVFKNGRADKSQYRLFKIKTAPKHDDLRALEEVISRRLNHKEWQYPDLIVVDGGKPQVMVIYKVLQGRHLKIPLIGISKFGGDKLIFSKNITKSLKELIPLMKITILGVRNEAHRFALRFSRKRRKLFKIHLT